MKVIADLQIHSRSETREHEGSFPFYKCNSKSEADTDKRDKRIQGIAEKEEGHSEHPTHRSRCGY